MLQTKHNVNDGDEGKKCVYVCVRRTKEPQKEIKKENTETEISQQKRRDVPVAGRGLSRKYKRKIIATF